MRERRLQSSLDWRSVLAWEVEPEFPGWEFERLPPEGSLEVGDIIRWRTDADYEAFYGIDPPNMAIPWIVLDVIYDPTQAGSGYVVLLPQDVYEMGNAEDQIEEQFTIQYDDIDEYLEKVGGEE